MNNEIKTAEERSENTVEIQVTLPADTELTAGLRETQTTIDVVLHPVTATIEGELITGIIGTAIDNHFPGDAHLNPAADFPGFRISNEPVRLVPGNQREQAIAEAINAGLPEDWAKQRALRANAENRVRPAATHRNPGEIPPASGFAHVDASGVQVSQECVLPESDLRRITRF